MPKGSSLAKEYWILLLTVDKCLSHYTTIILSLGPLIILEGAYDLKLVIKKKQNLDSVAKITIEVEVTLKPKERKDRKNNL